MQTLTGTSLQRLSRSRWSTRACRHQTHAQASESHKVSCASWPAGAFHSLPSLQLPRSMRGLLSKAK